MKFLCPLLMAASLLLPCSMTDAASPAFGNIAVTQNNSTNATNSVSLAITYSQAALAADGVTSLGSINLRTGSNRGDFLLRMTGTAANDRTAGILITSVSQLARDNSATGDPAGSYFATSATTFDSNGYFVSMQAVTSEGPEFNANFAAGWFPYADGWIGGHAVTTTNGGPITSLVGSPGLTFSTTGPGSNVLYDVNTTGVYELNLAGINSLTDGILLVTGGKNEDNYASSKTNADGTWSISVRDNFSSGGTEPDGLAFVYVPKTSVVSGDAPGVHAMGRLNGNLSRDVTGGTYAVVRSTTGVYKLYAPGIDPAQSSLLLSPESAGVNSDNVMFYEAVGKGWQIENRDLTGLGLQDNTATEDTFGFVVMASANTAGFWAGGGGNNNWTTAGNWTGGAQPAAGRDVVLGTASATVVLDSPQTQGMVMINRNTAFTLAGPSALTLNTGLIVNAQPTSAQNYTVSAPLILGNDAFILAQTLGSAVTLILDVPSGNSVTGVDKNLTLGGGSNIEIRDPMSLGTGRLIKEGGTQVTLTTAHSMAGTTIIGGVSSQTAGAFRLNAPAAYGAFGSGDIQMQNPDGITALYFDNAAGSGTLANNVALQSQYDGSGVRFLVDSGAAINVTMSGLISGGNSTSDFYMDSDAANGQGRLHLTNTGNTFLAQRVIIARGGLVIYGDGSLGDASNPLYLNTSNTNNNTGSGLHFGADNIIVNAARTVTINTNTVINTGVFQGTIAGEITGPAGMIKAGTGTLVLPRGNSYVGGTTVLAGTLSLQAASGSATGTGAVTVNGTATLSGAGEVAGAAAFLSGSTLSPGAGIGTLVFQSGLDLQAGSTTLLELLSGSSYDRVQVTGGSLQTTATSQLQVALQYAPQAGDIFDLLDWATLTGDTNLEDNLLLPSLAEGLQWDLSQFNSSGILSVQLVPEPSRALLMAAGFGIVLFRRRRC